MTKKTVFFCLIASLVLIQCNNSTSDKPLNVILIVVDTLAATHLSHLGYKRTTDPYLSSLKKESIVFTNHFSTAPESCNAHMSLFTGLYPQQHKINRCDIVTPKTKLPMNIFKIYKDNGYQTLWVGSNSRPSLNTSLIGSQNIADLIPFPLSAPKTVDKVIKQLKRYKQNKQSFFAFLTIFDVHSPYTPSSKYMKKLTKKKALSERELSFVQETFKQRYKADQNRQKKLKYTNLNHQDYKSFFWSHIDINKKKDIQLIVDLYDAAILQTDDQIRNLVKQLKNLDLLEKSILIVTSDHGESFGEFGNISHGHLQKSNMWIPLIIRHPKKIAIEINKKTSAIDVLPTLLSMTNIQPSKYNLKNGIDWSSKILFQKPMTGSDDRIIFGFAFGTDWANYHDWEYISEKTGAYILRKFDPKNANSKIENSNLQELKKSFDAGINELYLQSTHQ